MRPLYGAYTKVKKFVKDAAETRYVGDELMSKEEADAAEAEQAKKAGKKPMPSGDCGKVQGSYKKGGKVKKTGIYKLHKGERVLNKKQSKNWIAGAIKHPGVEKRAAAKAGMSTQAYMQEHKNDSGTAGRRARLGLTLSGMNKG